MILIIANARRKGGLSGGDNIYEELGKAEGAYYRSIMLDIDFKPFWLCYLYRIIVGCWRALVDRNYKKIEFVYSASDFLMDSLPALIYKLRGCKWVAGFYLFAPKKNKIYYYSQKIAYWFIEKYADVACVTNESMFDAFKGKKLIAVHGGVDLSKTKQSKKKEYDAVFVGRLHYTKGIKILTQIWDLVLREKPNAKLAIIAGGDTEENFMLDWIESKLAFNQQESVKYFGYMGDERFDIYSKSKMVLYPTPPYYSHFSMSPVEAMACGCTMVAFDLPVFKDVKPKGIAIVTAPFAYLYSLVILGLLNGHRPYKTKEAIKWAQTWDWSKRAPKILSQIREYLK